MVGRYEIARVVVVDLDGTLIRGNSFKLYVRVGLKKAGMQGKLRLLCALAQRKLGLITHNALREKCMSVIGFDNAVIDALEAYAQNMYSAAVLRFLEMRRAEGYSVLLATAALEPYVRAFWKDRYVATTVADYKVVDDCRGARKLRRVMEALGGKMPEYALSDSPADMPLLRSVAHAIVVNPEKAVLNEFSAIPHSILRDNS